MTVKVLGALAVTLVCAIWMSPIAIPVGVATLLPRDR